MDYVVEKRQYGRLTIFASFPNGCCTYASDLLAEYLIENGIRRDRIQILNNKADKGFATHCWLMIDNLYYVDITGDQFTNKPYFKKYGSIPDCCIVSKGTYFFERFLSRELQSSGNVGINTYSGDVPEKLQVVYNATVERINSNRN